MRTLRKVAALLIFVGLGLAAYAQGPCVIPTKIQKPAIQTVDCTNKMSPDYYALAVSWSPQHCSSVDPGSPKHVFQCSLNNFEFVVHGLWGQNSKGAGKCDHPRNCSASLVGESTITRTLCTIPGVDLIQGEWQKHGTCTGMTEAEYFDKTRELWSSLVKPNIVKLLNDKGETTAGSIVNAFVEANRKTGLFEKAVAVQTAGNSFSEVFICYDLQFKYAPCTTGKAPARKKIKVVKP